MLALALICMYLSGLSFVLGLMPMQWENRPTLEGLGYALPKTKKKANLIALVRKLSVVAKPLVSGTFRKTITRDLAIAHVNVTPEEFILIQLVVAGVFMLITFPSVTPDAVMGWLIFSILLGYMGPRFFIKGRIKKVKGVIIKELPDAIDLLGLCVNAGLDFMLALKWVVEKSKPSVMVTELNTVLQEINVGRTRRDAIKDLASRYELPDLSTFARTLIQADKMGTSVTEALNILSEDMRLARYRRGEQVALKSPLKMLVPLLVFIFPVVGIMVAGPILLDFIENNPFQSFAGGK
jgi:tight adherence protein C